MPPRFLCPQKHSSLTPLPSNRYSPPPPDADGPLFFFGDAFQNPRHLLRASPTSTLFRKEGHFQVCLSFVFKSGAHTRGAQVGPPTGRPRSPSPNFFCLLVRGLLPSVNAAQARSLARKGSFSIHWTSPTHLTLQSHVSNIPVFRTSRGPRQLCPLLWPFFSVSRFPVTCSISPCSS